MAAPITRFPITGPLELTVRLAHGRVRVDARDDCTEAIVRLDSELGGETLDRVVVEQRGRVLVVHGPREAGLFGFRRSDRDAIEVTVEVPAGTAVSLRTERADVEISGRCGSAVLATGAGAVLVECVAGDLSLQVGSGEVRVGAVTGSAQLRSDSGSIRLAEVGGRLESRSGSGDVSVDLLHGALHGRTGSGSVTVGAVRADVDFASGSGLISLGIPGGISARVDVTTGSGRLRSDLPVEPAPTSGARSIQVRARTGSGDIHLARAA